MLGEKNGKKWKVKLGEEWQLKGDGDCARNRTSTETTCFLLSLIFLLA